MITLKTKNTLAYALTLLLVLAGAVWLSSKLFSTATRIQYLGEVINLSGKQRMLSQRALVLALVDQPELAYETANRLAIDHKTLLGLIPLNRNQTKISEEQRLALFRIYYEDPYSLVKNMSMYIELFLAWDVSDAKKISDAAQLSSEILTAYNLATFEYQKLYEDEIDGIKTLSFNFALIVGALVMLFGIFIARPIANKLAKSQERLKAQATTDPLTGLLNRRGFFQYVAPLLKIAQGRGRPSSVLIADIDHFKNVNDTYGHDIGDLAIVHVVEIIKNQVRSSDVVARFGGEEFAVLLPEAGLIEANNTVAESIRKRLESTPLVLDDGVELKLTVSIGISTLMEFEYSLDQAFERADKALYIAKRNGRNRTALYRFNEESDINNSIIPL